ncbi:hypothetical protein [Flaviaesturariibacter terrae]
MRPSGQLIFSFLLLCLFSAQGQKRSVSPKEGLNLNFSDLADVELIVQHYTRFGQDPDAATWEVAAVSCTVPSRGFRVADSFYAAHAVANRWDDGDSVYTASIAVEGSRSKLTLRLSEDSGGIRIALPPAFRFSGPVHQPVVDSNVLTAGTQFTWQPAHGAADPVFVEIRYDGQVASGKRPRRIVEHRFLIPDSGHWIVDRRLLRGVPTGAFVSVEFNRGHFLSFRSGLFRYEASVFESAVTHFIPR